MQTIYHQPQAYSDFTLSFILYFMSETRENLKSILRKTADGLDTGNTILNEEEMSFLVDTISEVTSPDISTYTALNMSTLSKS